MIRIIILAPGLALRTGLRALLSRGEAQALRASPFPHRQEAQPASPTQPAPTGEDPAVTGAQIQVIFECATPAECIALAPEADVMVISGVSWEELETLFQRRAGQMAVLLISDSPAEALGLAALPLRGWGWLPLEASAEEMQTAVHASHLGLIAGAPGLMATALSLANGPLTNRPQPFTRTLPAVAQSEALTERETQVLQLLARGLANKQIALELGISEHTVKFHISSIYGKLGAASRTEAVRAGVQRGLITL